jgi:hypothetical protein
MQPRTIRTSRPRAEDGGYNQNDMNSRHVYEPTWTHPISENANNATFMSLSRVCHGRKPGMKNLPTTVTLSASGRGAYNGCDTADLSTCMPPLPLVKYVNMIQLAGMEHGTLMRRFVFFRETRAFVKRRRAHTKTQHS